MTVLNVIAVIVVVALTAIGLYRKVKNNSTAARIDRMKAHRQAMKEAIAAVKKETPKAEEDYEAAKEALRKALEDSASSDTRPE